jgi:hypothetical protein
MTPRFAGVDLDVTSRVTALLTLLGIYVGMLTVIALTPDGEEYPFLFAVAVHFLYVVSGKALNWYHMRPVRVFVRA